MPRSIGDAIIDAKIIRLLKYNFYRYSGESCAQDTVDLKSDMIVEI